jgi:hypothetical protein
MDFKVPFAFMVITGLAIGGVGLALYRIGRTSP